MFRWQSFFAFAALAACDGGSTNQNGSSGSRPGDDPAPTNRFLYVTGLVSNDVSIFAIRGDGTLAPEPRHVETGGGSRGIAMAPDGRTAYVAVGFDPNTEIDTNQVASYRVLEDGGLSPLGPRVDANGDPVSLAISPNGRSLYVTNRSSNTLSAFSITAEGTLSALGEPVPSGDVEPLGTAVTPDSRFAFVSHRGEDDTDVDVVTQFAIQEDGALAPAGNPVEAGHSGGAMAVTPDGQYLYVPSLNPGEVYAFRITDDCLEAVPGSPFPAPDLPISAAVAPDGSHLYVTDGGLLDSGSRLVSAFAIRDDGSLDSIGDFTAGESPVALMPAPDGRHLYVANIDTDDVTAFEIAATGDLSELAGSPFPLAGGEQPALQSIAISPL